MTRSSAAIYLMFLISLAALAAALFLGAPWEWVTPIILGCNLVNALILDRDTRLWHMISTGQSGRSRILVTK